MRTAILATMAFMLMHHSSGGSTPACSSGGRRTRNEPGVECVCGKILERQSKNIVAAAEEMRAIRFGYKPTPTQMTFGRTCGTYGRDEQFLVRADFGHVVSSGGELSESDPKGEANELAQGVIRLLLRKLSGQGRRLEAWQSPSHSLRAAGVACGGDDHSRHRLWPTITSWRRCTCG